MSWFKFGWVLLLSCSIGVFGAEPVWAAKKPSKKEKEQAELAAAAAQARLQVQQKAAEAINSTRWAIELVAMADKEKKVTKDFIKFEANKVGSEKLISEGFTATNCTLTINDDGATVWETMQTGPDSSVAFWRGEVQGESMRGILSRHSADGVVTDYAFSGRLAPAAELPPAAPAEAAAPAPEAKTEKP